ncbi:MAG: tripartite tricarboxylate transporter permease [Candidatus Pacearchaeota archaeon]
MLAELILALFIGILIGTLTGLIPGIHINLIGALLITVSVALLEFFSPITIGIFIVSMAITHTFIDFIPSIFLGAPDEDSVLSILPGHELLKNGEGYKAIILSTYGSIGAVFIIMLISPIFIIALPKFETTIKILIPYLLITLSMLLILKEKNKLYALFVFILSGFLGMAVFNSNIQEPFLPMLSGLFGASSLIISIKTKTKIPKQTIKRYKIDKKTLIPPLIASTFTAPITSFLPGVGSGQAAVLASSIKEMSREQFLVLLGAVNTIVLGLSFIVLYSIERKRTGMAVALNKIINELTLNNILTIIVTIILVGIICFYWTLFLGKFFSKIISKYNYTRLSIVVLGIISVIVFLFSGFLGFFIYIVSTATGLYGILTGVRRINLMGCLVVPVILFYLI